VQMFDTGATPNGKIDQVKATFNETLATSNPAGTTQWTLANIPSGGTLNTPTVLGTVATLPINEGIGAADTSIGSFTIALATSATGIRDAAGNLSSFAATAPVDKAGPTPTAISSSNNNGTVNSGDTLVVTFSEPLAPASVNTTASAATLTFSQNASSNILVSIAGLMATSDTGVDKGDGWVGNGGTITYRGTLTLSATNQVTFTAGIQFGTGTALAGNIGTLVFIPNSALQDAAANAANGSKSYGPPAIRLF
jgi:hypothetical protein